MYLEIWRAHMPPPCDDIWLYDKFVTLDRANIRVSGKVAWSAKHQMYTFQPAQHLHDEVFERFEVIVPSEYYLEFRDVIRSLLGIYITIGIYDEQCPPTKVGTDLQNLFTPTPVTIKT